MDLQFHFKKEKTRRYFGAEFYFWNSSKHNCLHAQFIKSLLVFKPIFLHDILLSLSSKFTTTAHYMYVLYCYDLLCKQHGCMLLTWETEILTSTCLTFSFGELVNIVFHIVPYQVRSSSVYSWSINTWKRNKPHILDYCVIRAFFLCLTFEI